MYLSVSYKLGIFFSRTCYIALSIYPSISLTNKRIFFLEPAQDEQPRSFEARIQRIKNESRNQSTMTNNLGKSIPKYDDQKWNKTNLPFDVDKVKTPYDYLKVFIPDSLVSKIVEETKLYAAQKNKFDLKIDENTIRASHAILFLSGYMTPATRRQYWENRDDSSNKLARKCMSRNTFEELLKYIHFENSEKPQADNSFWKVECLFDTVNQTAKLFTEDSEFYSIDEAMVRYFGPHGLKQFIQSKPTRFGFKLWCIASPQGVLKHVVPYAGSKTKLPNYGLSQGPDVVLGMCEKAQLKPGDKVICDNLFTSFDLMDKLSEKGIGILGTLRQNRLNDINLPSKAEAKKMKRGEHKAIYVDEDKLAVCWRDSGAVYIGSNFAPIEPQGTCKRYSHEHKAKKDFPQPHLIKIYNSSMGGVDLLDNANNCYAISIKTKKWYSCLYNWTLNTQMTQAWHCFRRIGDIQNDKNMMNISLLDFTRSCVEMLAKYHGENLSTPYSAMKSVENRDHSRYDNIGHIIQK